MSGEEAFVAHMSGAGLRRTSRLHGLYCRVDGVPLIGTMHRVALHGVGLVWNRDLRGGGTALHFGGKRTWVSWNPHDGLAAGWGKQKG